MKSGMCGIIFFARNLCNYRYSCTSIVQLGLCDYLFYHSIYLILSMGHLIDMYLGHVISVPKIQINPLQNHNSITKSMLLKHFVKLGILFYPILTFTQSIVKVNKF